MCLGVRYSSNVGVVNKIERFKCLALSEKSEFQFAGLGLFLSTKVTLEKLRI